jgi:hypothetical protein
VPETQPGIGPGGCVIIPEARIPTAQDGEWSRPKEVSAESRRTGGDGASADGCSVCPHGEVALALPSGVG